jgi:hypothetical protein
MKNKAALLVLVLNSIFFFGQIKQTVYFAPDPGPAKVAITPAGFSLSNAVLKQDWSTNGGSIRGITFSDLISRKTVSGPASLFTLVSQDGRVLDASVLKIAAISQQSLEGVADASRLSERFPGRLVRVQLVDDAGTLHLEWRCILRDHSNYVRHEVEVQAKQNDLPISEVRLLDWLLPGAQVIGVTKGSPVVAGTIFAGFEHPLSSCSVALGRVRCKLERELPLRAGHKIIYSSVIGVVSPGELRRGFLNYVERERAHPYRTFLHYNSWYDLGYFNQYDETGALDVVRTFGVELAEKRGVKLSSFLFDDGWDNPATLWKFNSGFPDGFAKVRAAAELHGADPGVWMSPWGGYGKPKQQRVEYGKAAGNEIVDNGFALSGPKYYTLFRDTCVDMMRNYGVNQFKFDGTGNANLVFPGSEFDSDFDAAIALIGELRAKKPDIFINLTTGTYPSPFWLRYADSIWRGGEDHSFLGVGSKREQWITYRDADTYSRVVRDGPLYPLNSLMLHGLIFARYAKNLQDDPTGDFKNEVRDYFGTGTQLQEMYITPSSLSQSDWDNLAEAANWSRTNADVLVDTHWIGGDPAQMEPYGWASWSPRKAILALRNPSDKSQDFAIDIAKAFELPAGADRKYVAHSPWQADAKAPATTLQPGQVHTFELKPFEVLVLDAIPSPN